MLADLTDEEITALERLLRNAIEGDRYPLSLRVQMLQGIRAKLRPEPAKPATAPEPKIYESPSKGRYRRRGR
jgi:hypothetical protein